MCAVAFMDLLDGTIVNVALPVIRTDLRLSVQSLQWVQYAMACGAWFREARHIIGER